MWLLLHIGLLALVTFPLIRLTVCGNCQVRCGWLAWAQWTDCSATCGGGRRGRSRELCCDTTLTINQCLASCGVDYSGFRDYADCNTICYNEATYSSGSCQCGDAYYGSCCSGVITCGSPSTIENGGFTGTDFNHGDTITYYCDDKYEPLNGNETLTCERRYWWQSYGTWDGDVPYCAYVRSCESNPCHNNATCTNGYDEYTCICLDGWTGSNCEFDIQPPVHKNCPKNVTYFSEDPEYYVTWSEPEFWDPFGNDVVVSYNYPSTSALLPWGDHVVQFVGEKTSNGLRDECIFTISVYTYPCEPLPTPKNGAFGCNGWNDHLTEVCFLFCKDGYDVPLGLNINEPFVCGASGNWMPFNVNVSCSEITSTGSIDSLYVYEDGCSSASGEDSEIHQKYVQLITQSDFSDLCLADEWRSDCVAENVNIIC